MTFVVDQEDGSTQNIGIRETVEADDLTSSHVLEADTFAIATLGTEQLRSSSAIAKAKAINASTDLTGVYAIVGKSRTDYDYENIPNLDAGGLSVFSDLVTGDTVLGNSNAVQATTLDEDNVMYINGTAITGFEVQDNDADGALVSAINAEFEHTGVVASLNAEGELVLEAEDGRNIVVQYRQGDGTRNLNLMDDIGLLDGADGDFVYGGKISLVSDEGFTIENFADVDTFITTNDALGVLSDALDPVTGESFFVEDQELFFFKNQVVVADVDVTTVDQTERSILTLDYALNQVSDARSKIGAQINRFESALSALETEKVNLSETVSRIQDADFASETALLAQSQITQRASVSVLAQTKTQNRLVLALL